MQQRKPPARRGRYLSFNPHPTRRPGATWRIVGRVFVSNFSYLSFNPHPTRRPGATRVKRPISYFFNWFQSSPDPEAGCNWRRWFCRCGGDGMSFNPHPTRRPGATLMRVYQSMRHAMFQSSPDPEAGCNLDNGNQVAKWAGSVSILTRPGGRVQLPHRFAAIVNKEFQSSPDPEAGCNVVARFDGGIGWRVSILTRPGGRVQPPTRRPDAPASAGFKPHPTRRPGATSFVALFRIPK